MATSPVTNFKTILATGLASGGSETTIFLNSVTTTDSHPLVMSDIGDIGFIVINPGGSTMEICSFTGISGTTLTGVTRGLPFYGTSTAAVTANKKAHSSGETVVISDNHQWFTEQYVSIDDDQTINGIKTFSVNPVTTAGNPTSATQLATKAYVDLTATGSATTDKIVIAGTAGETITIGQLVYLKVSDGRWWLCDADTAATVEEINLGLAQGGGTAGGAITSGVLTYGKSTAQTGLTANTKYYAGNTAGAISTSAGTTEVTVGYALSTTSIFFSPRYDQVITEDLQDALVGTLGTPSSTNKFVTDADTATTGANKVVRLNGSGLLDSSLAASLTSTGLLAGENISAGNPVAIGPYMSDGGITLDYKITSNATASGGSSTIAGQTIGNHSNRIVVVSVSNAIGNNPAVTWKGDALTLAKRKSDGGTINQLSTFYMIAPTVGTWDFIVSGLGASEVYGYTIHSYYNVSQSAPAETDTSSTTSISNTMTPTAIGSVIYTATHNTTTTLATTNFAGNVNTTNYSAALTITAGDSYKLSNLDTITIAHTRTAGSSNSAMVNIELVPATAATFRLFKASSDTGTNYGYNLNWKSVGFLGFSTAGYSLGDTPVVMTYGTITGLSSLKPGSIYYLADTAGNIGATAGTVSHKVGIAITTSTLVIRDSF